MITITQNIRFNSMAQYYNAISELKKDNECIIEYTHKVNACSVFTEYEIFMRLEFMNMKECINFNTELSKLITNL